MKILKVDGTRALAPFFIFILWAEKDDVFVGVVSRERGDRLALELVASEDHGIALVREVEGDGDHQRVVVRAAREVVVNLDAARCASAQGPEPDTAAGVVDADDDDQAVATTFVLVVWGEQA